MHRFLRRLKSDERGTVTAYVALFSVVAMGLGAVAVDIGRMGVLKTQMQNRADAGAMAGAAQLDGRDGARARAMDVAINAMTQSSDLVSGNGELSVDSIVFYEHLEPAVLATSDETARFIEVNLSPKTINYIFRPGVFSGSTETGSTMGAEAAAQPDPYMCHAPPLMICDLGELDASVDLSSNAVVGRQVVLKPPHGGGAWAPGNYGLLALPDGSIGASSLESALAAVQPQDCYGLEVGTAPGVKTNKVQSGINARFEYQTSWGDPAPNVINYPRDADILDGSETSLGNATWDLAAYWSDKHGTALPTELIGATRYQVYLYELGETFGRNGKLTEYPVEGSVSSGFSEIIPPTASIPEDSANADDPNFDGVPSGTVASNGAMRRIVQVAILQCVAEGVSGSHVYPTNGKYLEMFLTEAVPEEPAGGIYGEIVRPLALTTTPDFHANVKLVR